MLIVLCSSSGSPLWYAGIISKYAWHTGFSTLSMRAGDNFGSAGTVPKCIIETKTNFLYDSIMIWDSKGSKVVRAISKNVIALE